MVAVTIGSLFAGTLVAVTLPVGALVGGCLQTSHSPNSASGVPERLTSALRNAPSAEGWCQLATADEIESTAGFSPETVINTNELIPTAQGCEYGNWDGDVVKVGVVTADAGESLWTTCETTELTFGTAARLCHSVEMGTTALTFDFQPTKRLVVSVHRSVDSGVSSRADQVQAVAQLIAPRLDSVVWPA